MRKFLILMLASACGPGSSFNGKVSGYPLEVKDAIFTVPVVNGRMVGASLVLTDKPKACDFLADAKLPGSTGLATLSFSQWANGTPLAIDVGDFPVVQSMPTSATGLAVQGLFIRTDANGNQSLPLDNAAMKSGMVKVTGLTLGEAGSLQGNFDLRFGSGDSAQGAFSAQYCSYELLKSGALFSLGLSSSSTGRSAACTRAIGCGAAVPNIALADATQTVEQCEQGSSQVNVCCDALTATYKATFNDGVPSVCN